MYTIEIPARSHEWAYKSFVTSRLRFDDHSQHCELSILTITYHEKMRAILFAFLFGAAIAAPADDLALRAPTIACSTVRKAVTAAGVASQATAFCSSYLSIPTVTTKVTSTNTA